MIEKRIVDQTIENPDSSLAKRYERWRNAFEILKEYPILGTGWGVYLGMQRDGSLNETAWRALPRWHNSFFEIASQMGIFGLLSYYFIWYRIGQISINSVKTTHDYRDLTVLSGMIASVVAILIYSLGEQQFFAIETASFSWFIVGLLMFYINYQKAKKEALLKLLKVAR